MIIRSLKFKRKGFARMNTYQLGVMYGDGIGQEVVEATLVVLKAAKKMNQ